VGYPETREAIYIEILDEGFRRLPNSAHHLWSENQTSVSFLGNRRLRLSPLSQTLTSNSLAFNRGCQLAAVWLEGGSTPLVDTPARLGAEASIDFPSDRLLSYHRLFLSVCQ
jgi:hypothetical protein